MKRPPLEIKRAGSPKKPLQRDAESRQARLKAALKANIARRKAQARARASDESE